MTLEVGKILLGDDVKKEVEAVGVLWIRIKKAVGLSKQDRSGSSDAYITLAYSKGYVRGPIEWIQRMMISRMKYEKPMYSTRVIIDDLNPIWEGSTA